MECLVILFALIVPPIRACLDCRVGGCAYRGANEYWLDTPRRGWQRLGRERDTHYAPAAHTYLPDFRRATPRAELSGCLELASQLWLRPGPGANTGMMPMTSSYVRVAATHIHTDDGVSAPEACSTWCLGSLRRSPAHSAARSEVSCSR